MGPDPAPDQTDPKADERATDHIGGVVQPGVHPREANEGGHGEQRGRECRQLLTSTHGKPEGGGGVAGRERCRAWWSNTLEAGSCGAAGWSSAAGEHLHRSIGKPRSDPAVGHRPGWPPSDRRGWVPAPGWRPTPPRRRSCRWPGSPGGDPSKPVRPEKRLPVEASIEGNNPTGQLAPSSPRRAAPRARSVSVSAGPPNRADPRPWSPRDRACQSSVTRVVLEAAVVGEALGAVADAGGCRNGNVR